MTDIRDLIARAIFNGEFRGVVGATLDKLWDAQVENWGDDTNWHNQADAVLAVLADLPADVIEQAARGAYDGAFLKHAPAEVDRWSDLVADNDPAVESWREVARQAFSALFGGEQA